MPAAPATPARDEKGKFLPADQQPDPKHPIEDLAAKPGEGDKPPGEKGKEDLTPMQMLAETFLEVPEAERAPVKPKDEKQPEKPKKPAAPKPKATPRTPVAPAAATPESIAAAAAEAATRAIASTRQTEKPAPKPDDTDMDPADKAKIPVLERMAQLYPAKYKGIVDKYTDSFARLKAYVEDWKKAHPGQEYNEEDEEHNEFFEKNVPDWTDEDYLDAQVDLRAEAKADEKIKPLESKLSEYDRQQAIIKAQPQVAAERLEAAKAFWKTVGNGFESVFGENNQIDQKKVDELKAADPVGFEIRSKAATALFTEVDALYNLMNNLENFDEKNPVHVNINGAAERLQSDLLKLPEEDRRDGDGRMFLSREDYYKKLDRNKGDTERMYWTLGVRDITTARSRELAEAAGQIISEKEKEFEAWAKARGIKPKADTKDNAAETRQPKAAPPEEEPLETADGKPISPTTEGESRLAAVNSKGTQAPPDALQHFGQRFLE